VRSKLAIDQLFKERGYAYQAQVAFSGTVRDGGQDYTEPGMNGLPEVQTAKAFERPEYRFLIVANKFQTGFDQPLLHTMYVDKQLGGVNAVQTLSRLNRIHPDKTETMVLDFANEADAIQKAFAPYYEKTLLSESTDPHLLYDLERRLLDFHVYDEADIASFAALYFRPKVTQDQLYSALAPSLARFQELPEEEQVDFRGQLTDYVRLYAFLAQILTFADADLEKLYVFARLLRRYLPSERAELPREIQQNVDMDSYRIQPIHRGAITLERGAGPLDPQRSKDPHTLAADAIEPLSQIIHDLNERFGTDFSEEDRVVIAHLVQKLTGDLALATSVQVNTPENARLTFDHVVTDHLQDMVDTNFQFYKRVTDDQAFARFFLDWLFDLVQAHLKGGE
jgi:type I restriction enzyme, R subunit